MSISAEILTMGQNFDLQTGEQSNYLLFRLLDGTMHQAFVSDETATSVVALFVQQGGKPVPAASVPVPIQAPSASPSAPVSPPGFSSGYTDEGAEAHVFGGEAAGPPPVEAAPPAAVMPRGRLVGKDDAGNPIVEYPGGVHVPLNGAGGIGLDEDGVAQA